MALCRPETDAPEPRASESYRLIAGAGERPVLGSSIPRIATKHAALRYDEESGVPSLCKNFPSALELNMSISSPPRPSVRGEQVSIYSWVC
jgi:hypothetical protein